MINLYSPKGIRRVTVAEFFSASREDVLWIDLLDPTPDELDAVENLEDLSLPTRNEAQEIEVSSRLYIDNRALFMTATVMVRAIHPNPVTTPVTFAYRPRRLVTLRFDDPTPFKGFALRYERNPDAFPTAQKVFLGLFDEVVDRLADILEFVAADLNDLSALIFMGENREPGAFNYNEVLRRIGQDATRTANARESLVSLRRVHGFFTEACGTVGQEQVDEHWRITGKDVIALADHATFVSSKVTFILDATLGLINSDQNTINSQQNRIIKLFSVLAVGYEAPRRRAGDSSAAARLTAPRPRALRRAGSPGTARGSARPRFPIAPAPVGSSPAPRPPARGAAPWRERSSACDGVERESCSWPHLT